jgi:ABC-type phosphate/phosphonate transport system substrate-binding protein
MPYVANARMYSVNPAAAAAWRELFEWLARQSGVALQVIDHAFPLSLAELWSRPDLGCAFMCGFPYMLASQRPQTIAAPVPRHAVVPGRPVYATRLIVNADSRFQTLEDTFGGRLGFTVSDSHSGYNALRHHLLPYRLAGGGNLYRESIGPLFTPRRVVDAVLSGAIDVGPLDSYALDLMIRHAPGLARQIRVVATTAAAPMPFLIASRSCPDEVVAALRTTLLAFGSNAGRDDVRDALCLTAFVPVDVAEYQTIAQWDSGAREAGYAVPG